MMRRCDRPTRATRTGCRTAATITSSASARSTRSTTATSRKLGLAWQFETATERGLEATPLVIDGVMYATGSWSVTYAIDARSGKQLWKYDPEVHRKYDNIACCDVVNRGAAFYKGKVYVGVLDGRLAALDANTGKVAWQTTTVDQNQPYTITGAPRIANGKIIIGNGGAEYGVRGYVSAYDAETGKLAWRFYTVPGDPSKPQENTALERALPTWKGNDWWKYGGGGTVWDSIVYDPELNLLYVGTGNGSTWNRHVRSPGGGDNLYLASILAINPDNGELVWHYQTTPGDTWDYTAVQPMMLADLQIGGRLRKVIMQAPKNGFFYVIDRATGELLSADKYVEVNWASHVDMKTGRPVEIAGADYEKAGAYIRPGPLGGHNWQAMSFSPTTGLVYLPAQDNGRYLRAAEDRCRVQADAGRSRQGAAAVQPGTRLDRAQLREVRSAVQGPPAGVGSGRPQAAVDRRVRRVLEWRHARDRRQPRVPGHRGRRFHRLQRRHGRQALVVVGDDRHRGAADHLFDRRQAIRVGDGGVGRRVFEEDGQLRPPADIHDRRHSVVAGALAPANVQRDCQQRASRSRSRPVKSSSTPTACAATAARRFCRTCAVHHRRCWRDSRRFSTARWSSAACRGLASSTGRRSRSCAPICSRSDGSLPRQK